VAAAAGVLLIASARPRAAEGATAEAPAMPGTQYRGFTTPSLDPALLSDAATKWHANIVRYIMRPQFQAEHGCHCTNMEAWQKMLAALPAELDTAKQLHMTVVLAMFEAPVEHYPEDGGDHAANAAFWSDNHSLDVMTQAWAQVAKICADRDQVIWFDLKNEPTDFNGPGSPRNWPSWAQSLIDGIRQIDQQHQIVIEPGNGGSAVGFKFLPKMRGEGLIYSFHQYQPYDYTMQGNKGQKDPGLAQAYLQQQLSWPGTYSTGSWDKRRVEQQLQPAIDFQNRYGVRMYVGEFSVVRWAPNATQWLRDNIDIFEKHGWDWTYHGFREHPMWSLEYSDDYQNPKNLQNSGQQSDRGQVLLDYLSRNASQQ
jgi:endoglucanase